MKKLAIVLWLLFFLLVFARCAVSNSGRNTDDFSIPWNILGFLASIPTAISFVQRSQTEPAKRATINLRTHVATSLEKSVVILEWHDSYGTRRSFQYSVFRKETTATHPSELKRLTATSFQDDTVVSGKSYIYWVAWSHPDESGIPKQSDRITLSV